LLRAAIAARRVAVVALLARIDDSVTAERILDQRDDAHVIERPAAELIRGIAVERPLHLRGAVGDVGREIDVLEPPLAIEVVEGLAVRDRVLPGDLAVDLDRGGVVRAVLDGEPPPVLEMHLRVRRDIDRGRLDPGRGRRGI